MALREKVYWFIGIVEIDMLNCVFHSMGDKKEPWSDCLFNLLLLLLPFPHTLPICSVTLFHQKPPLETNLRQQTLLTPQAQHRQKTSRSFSRYRKRATNTSRGYEWTDHRRVTTLPRSIRPKRRPWARRRRPRAPRVRRGFASWGSRPRWTICRRVR